MEAMLSARNVLTLKIYKILIYDLSYMTFN